MVYIFKITNQDYYKIGFCNQKSVPQRLSQLQTGSPYIMEIYAVIETNPSQSIIIEHRLHDILKDYRVQGEWFQLPIDIANRLKELASVFMRLEILQIEDCIYGRKTVNEIKQEIARLPF